MGHGDDHAHDSDCDVYGAVPALSAARPSARSERNRVGDAGRCVVGRPVGRRESEPRTRLHAHRSRAGAADHGVWFRRQRAAGVAAARSARLSERLRENRCGSGARRRHPGGAAAACHAGRDQIRGRHRARVQWQGVSVRLHHHRLRCDQRFPFVDRQRHHAEAAVTRDRRPADRLRRNADGITGRDHGPDRRLRVDAGRVFRHQRPRRRAWHDGRERGAGSAALGLRASARRDGRAGQECRRIVAAQSHRRRSIARGGHGASVRSRARRWRHGTLVSLRNHVRSAVHTDDARRRHASRALHAAGPGRSGLAEVSRSDVAAGGLDCECNLCIDVGLFPLSGCN